MKWLRRLYKKHKQTNPSSYGSAAIAGALYSCSLLLAAVCISLVILVLGSGMDFVQRLELVSSALVWVAAMFVIVAVFIVGSLALRTCRFSTPFIYGSIGGGCVLALYGPFFLAATLLDVPLGRYVPLTVSLVVVGSLIFMALYWCLRQGKRYIFVGLLVVVCATTGVAALSWVNGKHYHLNAVDFTNNIPYKIFVPESDTSWAQSALYGADGSYLKSSYVQTTSGDTGGFERITYWPAGGAVQPREQSEAACVDGDPLDVLGRTDAPRECLIVFRDDFEVIYLERNRTGEEALQSAPYIYYVVRGGTVVVVNDTAGEEGRERMLDFLRDLRPATSDEWARLYLAGRAK